MFQLTEIMQTERETGLCLHFISPSFYVPQFLLNVTQTHKTFTLITGFVLLDAFRLRPWRPWGGKTRQTKMSQEISKINSSRFTSEKWRSTVRSSYDSLLHIGVRANRSRINTLMSHKYTSQWQKIWLMMKKDMSLQKRDTVEVKFCTYGW